MTPKCQESRQGWRTIHRSREAAGGRRSQRYRRVRAALMAGSPMIKPHADEGRRHAPPPQRAAAERTPPSGTASDLGRPPTRPRSWKSALTGKGDPHTRSRAPAQVAELVDAHGSGPCAARRGGSSPLLGTIFKQQCEYFQSVSYFVRSLPPFAIPTVVFVAAHSWLPCAGGTASRQRMAKWPGVLGTRT